MQKIDKEMDAAIAKYGKIKLPSQGHIDGFYDRIDREKEKLAKAAGV